MINDPATLTTLALAHLDAGRPQEALALLKRSTGLAPDDPDTHFYLGLTHGLLNHLDRSIEEYREALRLNPRHVESHGNLANALRGQGRIDEALEHYRAALAARPDFTDARVNLGSLLIQLGSPAEALGHLREVLRLQPQNVVAWGHLGAALQDTGALASARDAFREAIRLGPADVASRNNLGSVLRELHQPDDALAAFEEAHRLAPNNVDILNNLGSQYADLAFHDHALASFRQALALNPLHAQSHSNLLYSLLFNPAADVAAQKQELERWNQAQVVPLASSRQPHANVRDAGRRLRIGYVSPDFYLQAESFFTVPLFEAHDRDQYEIHCYSSVRRPDHITARIRRAVEAWHDVTLLTDDQLASQIRADGIDILVDLTMHMANNRALVFARKPAPVQFAWLAYPGSTGNSAIDYRLSDPHLDPPNAPAWTEQALRLPETWVCYHPLVDAADPALAPTALPEQFTFGSLNNPCKINAPLLLLWSRLLHAVPEARLLLLCPSRIQRDFVLRTLEHNGIAPAHISFLDRQDRLAYLQAFRQITVAIDTLPYNGITTTLDALWMGTPVVTLIGSTPAGRAGLSILANLHLNDFITRTPEDFVTHAAALAKDHARLTDLRTTLRPHLQSSPLMNAPRFAQNLEHLYRQAWQKWINA